MGKPTYVWPYTLKRVVREVIPGDQVDMPDPTHAKVSSKFLNFFSCSRDKEKHINNGSEKKSGLYLFFHCYQKQK